MALKLAAVYSKVKAPGEVPVATDELMSQPLMPKGMHAVPPRRSHDEETSQLPKASEDFLSSGWHATIPSTTTFSHMRSTESGIRSSALRLRPRVLRNVAERRIEVTLLGDQKLSMPVGISPTAFQKLAHPDGEIAVAKAAQAARTLMTLSSFSNDCLEDVQRGAPGGLRWFQLFLFMDREFTRNLVERAERSGYRAIVLTVDMPVRKTPDFAKMSNFCIPEHLRHGNFLGISRHEDANPKLAGYDDLHDPSVTWADVTWLRSITKLPVVAKGICTAEDAEEAIHYGVSAILVSNHGGRLLQIPLRIIQETPG
ncbi:hydroxyacid oxidase 1-like [Ixodes scapularis]